MLTKGIIRKGSKTCCYGNYISNSKLNKHRPSLREQTKDGAANKATRTRGPVFNKTI